MKEKSTYYSRHKQQMIDNSKKYYRENKQRVIYKMKVRQNEKSVRKKYSTMSYDGNEVEDLSILDEFSINLGNGVIVQAF